MAILVNTPFLTCSNILERSHSTNTFFLFTQIFFIQQPLYSILHYELQYFIKSYQPTQNGEATTFDRLKIDSKHP